MKLTISKIDRTLFSGDAVSVTLPSRDGEITVLANHTPLISTLKEGTIIVRKAGGQNEEFPITTGFLEVGKSGATILV